MVRWRGDLDFISTWTAASAPRAQITGPRPAHVRCTTSHTTHAHLRLVDVGLHWIECQEDAKQFVSFIVCKMSVSYHNTP